ncbi:MAG: glycoside hydrolase family 9 protein [Clostridium sp.]|nr:glycoside hydrolase family 9 protein [Clostridium sp.]MCM1547078.1 glycoside hydrolase family 9 protein [Ruminococcus sp.]
MHKKLSKIVVSSLMSVTMLATTVATVAPMNVSAGEVLGETTFDHKAVPWHTCESSPAKQELALENGEVHIKILKAEGADHEKWDLQFRHRNLHFKANHTYKVSFKAKAKRSGMQLCSKIGNIKGDEEYFVLNETQMQMGPHMGGNWGKAAQLTTSYQTFSGTFTPTKDLESIEWCMHYAKGTQYEGNAVDGDEIWFDDMTIECTTCSDCDADPLATYGIVNRDNSAYAVPDMKENGTLVNYISVNQIGYYTNLAKTATLGDNQGDIMYGATKITLDDDTYTYELVNAETEEVVHTGKTGKKFYDKDSHDNVCKIDFSSYTTPGRYFLRIKDKGWRSMEFNIGDNIYSDDSHDMLTNALNYFYQNRSGVDIEEEYITSGDKSTLAHEGGHKTDSATVQKAWVNEYSSKEDATNTYASKQITANRGWYDAGDHGKYVVNGGIAVWTLQNMYERAAQTDAGKEKFANGSGTVVIPETDNNVPDILDEAAFELDWMTDMVVKEDDPEWGKYAGLVYHKLHDHKWTGLAVKPWDYAGETLEDGSKGWDTVRIVKPPTFAATLNYAACAAQAARLWKPYDVEKAKFYLEEAKNAYTAYEKYYYPAAADEEYNEKSLYAPLYQAKGGGAYGDNEVKDDAYWAACEIFVSAKEMGDSDADTYYNKAAEYKEAFEVTTRITGGENKDGSLTTFNWGNTASAGSLTLALHKDLLKPADAEKVEKTIIAAADTYIATEEKQGYGIPYLYDGPGYTDPVNLPESTVINGYEWGSNSMVINNCIVMAYAYDLTDDGKYMNGVANAMNYLLGCNPLSFSYITGYGLYKETNPHHRYWSHEMDKTLPLAPDGILSGGPNAGLQDPYARALGFVSGNPDNPSQRCFVDSIEAWSTNEVTINWNAPLAWIVSFMQDEATGATPDLPDPTDPTDPTDEPDPTDKPDPSDNPDPSEPTKGSVTVPTDKESIENALWGDVNVDGQVAISDLVLLNNYLLEVDEAVKAVTPQGLVNANVEYNDTVDQTDSTYLLNYLSNQIAKEKLGPQK